MMCLEWESWRQLRTEHMSDELGGHGDETMDPLSCRGEWTEGRESGRRCGLFRYHDRKEMSMHGIELTYLAYLFVGEEQLHKVNHNFFVF